MRTACTTRGLLSAGLTGVEVAWQSLALYLCVDLSDAECIAAIFALCAVEQETHSPIAQPP